jgi:hypothetical protein
MKRIFTLILSAAAMLAGSLNAQISPRPRLEDFKTLEDYMEAFIDWKLDQRPPALRKDQTQQPPTATEIFNLRSQCKVMVQKEAVGTQLALPKLKILYWARYNPQSNHCYASMNEIDDHTTTRVLIDVQSGEELASAREGLDPRDEWGSIPGKDLSKLSRHDGYMRALEYMVSLTKE